MSSRKYPDCKTCQVFSLVLGRVSQSIQNQELRFSCSQQIIIKGCKEKKMVLNMNREKDRSGVIKYSSSF